MKNRYEFRLILVILVVVVGFQSSYAQQNTFDFFIAGGMNMPAMDDVNDIYIQDLTNYNDVNYAYDLAAGLTYNFRSNLSIKLGFNYLRHAQNPAAELIESDGDTTIGYIHFRIKAYTPFLGLTYSRSVFANYQLSLGLNLVACKAKLSDEFHDADIFFDYLHGSSFGTAFEASITRAIIDQLHIGTEFGYRMLHIKESKIDSNKYEDQTEDIVFKLNNKTVDLNFSGPFIRLILVYKL